MGIEIVLLLTFLLAGEDKPHQQGIHQPDMATCESEAHRYNVAKVPDNVVLASSACLRIRPQTPGHDT